MSIRIITFGQPKGAFTALKTLEDQYINRLAPWLGITCTVLKGEKVTDSVPADVALAREAELLAPYIQNAQNICVLSEKGKTLSSDAFAQQLGKRLQWPARHAMPSPPNKGNRPNRGGGNTGPDTMIWVIGNAYGLSPHVLQQANWLVSLSAMTYPHDMVRVMLLEQLFRAYKILKNEPYHK